jgi:hypothetical protein
MVKKKVFATYLVPVQVSVSYVVEAKDEKEMAQKLEDLKSDSVLSDKQVKNLKFDADMNSQKEDINLSIEQGQAKLLSVSEIEEVSDEKSFEIDNFKR